jgi:hypothetical protein
MEARMRQMTLGTLLVALLLTPLYGQSPALDVTLPSVRIPSVPQPCDIHGIVQKLGRITKLPVGFQVRPECSDDLRSAMGGLGVDRQFSTQGDTTDLSGLTFRQALDRLVALMPEYRWREMNGVAVVRPVTPHADAFVAAGLPPDLLKHLGDQIVAFTSPTPPQRASAGVRY